MGVRRASGACEEDRRGLALSEGAMSMCRDPCGLGPSRQVITTCCALVEGTVILSPYLAEALVPSSVYVPSGNREKFGMTEKASVCLSSIQSSNAIGRLKGSQELRGEHTSPFSVTHPGWSQTPGKFRVVAR